MQRQMDKPFKVESVTEFLNCIIEGTREAQTKYNFYYRGEKQYYPLRLPNFYTHEHSEKLVRQGSEFYYRSLINELGRADYSDSFSLFQLLSELQHYEAKTRMLDISSNPLVALYFATEENNGVQKNTEDYESDGHIYIFGEEINHEKFDTGHTVAIKSALNLISQEKINTFIIIMSKLIANLGDRDGLIRYKNGRNRYFLYESINELLDEACLWSDFLELKNENQWIFFGIPLEVILKKDEYDAFCAEVNDLDSSDSNKVLRNALQQILEEFLELINQRAKLSEKLRYPVRIYEDLTDAHIMLSSKRTDRLRQQQGAFIYPRFTNADISKAFDDIKKEIHNSIIEKAMSIRIGDKEYSHIVIPNDKKKVIQNELSLIGVDEGFIYPDIRHRSSALLNR
ncbi:FRG domain-containing protein [Streptococcus sanguinis]|uniref:FRG domain-containing protein n=1 Tax=Streptococcus sanguinis TaxID=1305 RepID=A0A7H8V6D7_STRSA|nr:FRG domain-containing protein [Streptococcus sanguinis]